MPSSSDYEFLTLANLLCGKEREAAFFDKENKHFVILK